jgi:hypothetical protein
LQCFEVGATARLPEIHLFDAWQRRQIPEPLVVGDPNVQVHHSGALKSSVDGLAGNYTPDAALRVLHIALTTRDQVNMGVTNSLSGYVAVVDADVETTHRTIPVHYLGSKFVQQLIDSALSGLNRSKKVAACRLGITSVCSSVTGYLSRIASERVKSDDPLIWNFTENAIRVALIDALPDYPKVLIVTRPFVRVAFEAQRLKIG